MDTQKNQFINGPYNIARLEGTIDGIDKVIYLFMDVHKDIKQQTQCSNIFSKDITKYLLESFEKISKGDKTYDFFAEIYPSELVNASYSKIDSEPREIYIEEVVKLFRKLFDYDPVKNKVKMGNIFDNVRLHYFDVRDYYQFAARRKIFQMIPLTKDFKNKGMIDIQALDYIILLAQTIIQHFEIIKEVLISPNNYQKKAIIKDVRHNLLDMNGIRYIADKLKESYQNKKVKEIMNLLIQKTVKNLDSAISESEIAIDTLKSIKNSKAPKNKIDTIINLVNDLYNNQFIEFLARFTDIHFLRRFLDKKYITNAIVYSGGYHSYEYIHILVKYFDFKITHIYKNSLKTIDKLNEGIRKTSESSEIRKYFNTNLSQCVDMKNFPDNFE